MSREPEGEPLGYGIYRREYRGYLIDEAGFGFATLRDASGAELMNFDDYIDAEARADELVARAEIDRATILESFTMFPLVEMVRQAGQTSVPFGCDSQERRQLEAYRAIGAFIYGLDAWNAEWRKQGFAQRATPSGPGESYDRK